MVIAPLASFGRHSFCDLGHSHLPWQTTGRAMTFHNFGIHLSSQEKFALSGLYANFWPLHSKKRDPSIYGIASKKPIVLITQGSPRGWSSPMLADSGHFLTS